MTITEPSTMITNYALGAVALVASYALGRVGHRDRSVHYWIGALFFTGVAALAGGTSHGFKLMMGPAAHGVLWKGTLAAIGAATFCFAASTAYAAFSRVLRRVVVSLVAAQLLVFLWVISRSPDFRYAVYDYAPIMLAVLAIHVVLKLRRGTPASAWIIAGIIVSFAAALIQAKGFGFHEHFNHNDVYHVIQMGGVYCFYRGGCLLEDHAK
jgi:hypothetical protein